MPISDAARVVIAGFDGPVVSDHARELLKLGVGGFILFARNIQSLEQTADLVATLRDAAGRRPFVLAVDQEGGRVERLRPFATHWPTAREIGAADDPELARAFGRALGCELAALGFDLDFAPAVDVDTNPANPVIGDRAFGRDPDVVARLTAPFIAGLQGQGVLACAKHFPGHGDTDTDSHLALPRVAHDRARLESVEWPPFVAAIAAGVATVMTAHVVVSALDPDVPATFSPRVLSILRNDLEFAGPIVSDDLEMAAVADHYAPGDAAVRAARAGCDTLLVCKSFDRQEAAIRALHDAQRAGKLPPFRLADMAERLERALATRASVARPPASVVGCDEHRELAARLSGTATA